MAGLTTLFHAAANQAVDLLLALVLMVGGVIGAQFGTSAGQRLRSDQLRALLALLVLGVCFRLLTDLVTPPADRFTVEAVRENAG